MTRSLRVECQKKITITDPGPRAAHENMNEIFTRISALRPAPPPSAPQSLGALSVVHGIWNHGRSCGRIMLSVASANALPISAQVFAQPR